MKIKSVQINGLIYLEAKAIMKAFQVFANAMGVPQKSETSSASVLIEDLGKKPHFPGKVSIPENKPRSKKKMGRHAKDCECPKHKAKVEAVASAPVKNGKEKESVAA